MTLARRTLLLTCLALCGCLEPTQVTFKITTDIPCEQVSAVAITAGLEGETEKADPITVVKSCTSDGMVGAIGTYAVTPAASRSVRASFKAVVGVGAIDVESECTASNGYRGCVVARRRINFVAHRALVVPVELFLVCKDVQCDQNSSCNRVGRCVNSLVDTEQCSSDNVCNDTVTTPGEGLPCFNSPTTPPDLFCSGLTPWCTRDGNGMRACAETPLPGGTSYQCRDSRDCGPNQKCVLGMNGVLGKCADVVLPADTILCSPLEMPPGCRAGTTCSADAGSGLLGCATPVDAGLPDAGSIHGRAWLYVADQASPGLHHYEVRWSETAISVDGGASVALTGASRPLRDLQVVPGRDWLLATDRRYALVFRRDVSSGALNQASSTNISTSTSLQSRIAIHPNGRFAYVTADCGGTRNTTMVALDVDGGTLVDLTNPTFDGGAGQGSPRCTGSVARPDGVAVSADGAHLYVSGSGLEAYDIDSQTGAALQTNSVSFSTVGGDLVLLQGESMVVSAVRGTGRVRVTPLLANRSLDTARMAEVGVQPAASELARHPTLPRVYVVSRSDAEFTPAAQGSLWAADISADGGVTSQKLSDFTTMTEDAVITPDGTWALVSLPGTNQLAGQRLDAQGAPVGSPVVVSLGTTAPGTLLLVAP